jgi:hypothetical protein
MACHLGLVDLQASRALNLRGELLDDGVEAPVGRQGTRCGVIVAAGGLPLSKGSEGVGEVVHPSILKFGVRDGQVLHLL